MKKNKLNTRELKKLLSAYSINQRWHNKNKNGGNFGINIYYGKEFLRGRDKELTGYYNIKGELTHLKYGNLYSVGQNIPKEILKTNLNMLGKYLLYLNNNGDWLKFLIDNKLIEV